MEACENKWYNEGFADAENSVEPVIHKAQKLTFEEGWLAALQALRVPEDSPLRDPNEIPFSGPSLAVQNPPGATNKAKSPSMRELVEAIDSHVELVHLEVTNNLCASDQPSEGV